MSMVLQSKMGGDFVPHPEGIHPAVCLDVVDLGFREVEFQGQWKRVPKVRLVFETEQKLEDGRNCIITKNFTASLHPKARLAEFLGKWRGRPVVPGETIDLGKLIGACCTLVISHQQNPMGQTYAAIDAISKPTKRLVASGCYDPVAARQRLAEWQAKQQQAGGWRPGGSHQMPVASDQRAGNSHQDPAWMRSQGGGSDQRAVTSDQWPLGSDQRAMPPKSGAAPAAAGTAAPAVVPGAGSGAHFDPEVGF